MGVSLSGDPQIIHFNRVFHYKPSILEVPLFLETPICVKGTWNPKQPFCTGSSVTQPFFM